MLCVSSDVDGYFPIAPGHKVRVRIAMCLTGILLAVKLCACWSPPIHIEVFVAQNLLVKLYFAFVNTLPPTSENLCVRPCIYLKTKKIPERFWIRLMCSASGRLLMKRGKNEEINQNIFVTFTQSAFTFFGPFCSNSEDICSFQY